MQVSLAFQLYFNISYFNGSHICNKKGRYKHLIYIRDIHEKKECCAFGEIKSV